MNIFGAPDFITGKGIFLDAERIRNFFTIGISFAGFVVPFDRFNPDTAGDACRRSTLLEKWNRCSSFTESRAQIQTEIVGQLTESGDQKPNRKRWSIHFPDKD
jgi:hypothetical protein